MKHRIKGKKFFGGCKIRKAMMRALLTSLFTNLSIETTISKSKFLSQIAQKVVTIAKRNDGFSRIRMLKEYLYTDIAVSNAVTLAEKYNSRSGGYTTISRSRIRKADAAVMSVISFL